jgi:phage terminase small subunit
MKLTPRQQLFVAEYLIDGNGARAARSAGYSEKTARQIATENLSKPYIQAAIAAKQQETAVKLELRKEHVLLAHMEAIGLARAQGQPMAMISGAREVGKLMGFYSADAVEIAMSMCEASLLTRYKSMTDAELMAVIAGGAEKLL